MKHFTTELLSDGLYPAFWCSTLMVMEMDYLVVEDFLDTAGFHICLIMALQQPTEHGGIIRSIKAMDYIPI